MQHGCTINVGHDTPHVEAGVPVDHSPIPPVRLGGLAPWRGLSIRTLSSPCPPILLIPGAMHKPRGGTRHLVSITSQASIPACSGRGLY